MRTRPLPLPWNSTRNPRAGPEPDPCRQNPNFRLLRGCRCSSSHPQRLRPPAPTETLTNGKIKSFHRPDESRTKNERNARIPARKHGNPKFRAGNPRILAEKRRKRSRVEGGEGKLTVQEIDELEPSIRRSTAGLLQGRVERKPPRSVSPSPVLLSRSLAPPDDLAVIFPRPRSLPRFLARDGGDDRVIYCPNNLASFRARGHFNGHTSLIRGMR